MGLIQFLYLKARESDSAILETSRLLLNKKQLEEINGVDILAVPVGGKNSLDGKEAKEVIDQIEPKIVLPMHYKIRGSKFQRG